MNFLSDNSLLLMEKSMGFLWTKQAAILDNIANVETPNYKAKLVTFEDSLRTKLESARTSRSPRGQVRHVLQNSQFAVTEPQEVARMDENGVNLIEQSTELVRNAYQLQYVQQAISNDLAVLRSAIRGQ
ncbi:MAG: flagellar biosynthesis protein FlgB [Oscillospiraceae bacterium]|nr:flagellar biosynthesis protein FlgB [Oscillospiraceae bacterium]